MDTQNKNERLYATACFYKDKGKPVHIKLISGKWFNGLITSVSDESKDRCVLQEEFFGELLVFFDRIKDSDDAITLREEKR